MRELFISQEFLFSLMVIAFETLCILLFCGMFFRVRRRWSKWQRASFILFIIVGTTCIARILSDAGIIKGIIIVIFNTLMFTAYFRLNTVQAFFVYLIPYGMNLSIDILILFLIKTFLPDRYPVLSSQELPAVFLSLLCKTVFFFVIIGLKILWNRKDSLEILDRKEWSLFFYFPVFTFISCWIFIRNVEVLENYSPEFYVIAFGLIFINIIVFYLMKYIVGKENSIHERELMNQSNKSQLLSYHSLNNEYDRQRKYLHDYKNQLNCIQGMLQRGETKEAISFIASLTGSMIKDINLIHTGSPVVDAVVNQKYSVARSRHIPVIFSINDLSSLPMREEDIVSLLANLFDNAIEACEKTCKSKRIFCKLIIEDNQFVISMQNPVEKDIPVENGIIPTGKKNKNQHGIGLKNIESVITKYGGSYIITTENGIFNFSAIVPCGNDANDICK